MKNYYLFLLVVFQFGFSQTERFIHGKIICDGNPVQDIQVINLVSEKSTVSDNSGEFFILAKPQEMLVFSSINYDYKRRFLEQEDIDNTNILIKLTRKITHLDEVVINRNPKFDAVKLGILMKPAKEYTPAERRLKTATGLDAKANAGNMMGGSISLDPLLNWISGRTKLLKTELSVERNELLLAKVANLYNDEYYTEKLKIQQEYIKAFQYYVIYDFRLIAALNSKNKTLISFRMIELAQEFNKLQH